MLHLWGVYRNGAGADAPHGKIGCCINHVLGFAQMVAPATAWAVRVLAATGSSSSAAVTD